jgi:prepilin-type N-terminal cleavage/methylation domain-containing protein
MCFTRNKARRSTNGGVSGFTLLEILLAVTILSVVATVTFMTFSAASSAWQRGTDLLDRIHHGDFVLHQLMMALRSAYYPEAQGEQPTYGFWHVDSGDGPSAQDEISWVKLGGALVGRDLAYAESPHRVRFFLARNESGRHSAAVVSGGSMANQTTSIPTGLIPYFSPVGLSASTVGRLGRSRPMAKSTGRMSGRSPIEYHRRLR